MTDLTRDQIERLRDGWAATGWLSTDDAIALFDHAISEQSRIDAAVARERERCAGVAEACAREQERLARNASKVGRGTVFASWSGGHHAANHIAAAIRTPTPVTEEGE